MKFVLFIAVSCLTVVAQSATVKEPAAAAAAAAATATEDGTHKHDKRHAGASIDAASVAGATYPSYPNSLSSAAFDQASSLLTKDSTSITSAEFANNAASLDTSGIAAAAIPAAPIEAAALPAALPAAEYAPAFGAASLPVATAPAVASYPVAHHEGRLIHVSKDIYIKNRYAYPVAQPYPVTVEKPVPYPVVKTVRVNVDKPYQVQVPKPYPVRVEKPVPYKVDKPVPYPVVVKVPYPVYERVPVHIPKAIPIPMIRKPVCVQSKMELVPLSSLSGLGGGIQYTGGIASAGFPYPAAAGGFPASF